MDEKKALVKELKSLWLKNASIKWTIETLRKNVIKWRDKAWLEINENKVESELEKAMAMMMNAQVQTNTLLNKVVDKLDNLGIKEAEPLPEVVAPKEWFSYVNEYMVQQVIHRNVDWKWTNEYAPWFKMFDTLEKAKAYVASHWWDSNFRIIPTAVPK